MYIIIDFDDTIAKAGKATPFKVEIGKPKYKVKQVINKLYKEGHTIIINTLREDRPERHQCFLSEAKEWLNKQGIKYHYINQNCPKLIEKWGESRKLAGDVYIDDRNILPLTFWPFIYWLIRFKEWRKKSL